jgi:hypothetical protein
MTEYYDLPELSKGVEIKTTINVKDSYLIKTLKITRTNGSNVDVQDVPISDGDKTISFKPKPNENMAVSHTIKVTYTTAVSDTVKDGPSATIAISEDQLSLASTSKSGDVSLTVSDPSLSNNVLFTKNYVTIKLGTTDIFPEQQIYFSPASGNGFKIMGASGNSLNIVNGKVFYILAAGNKNMIATTATETPATEYLTYTDNTLSLSIKTINFQNKLFDITFGSAVPAPPSSTPTPSSTPSPTPSSTPSPTPSSTPPSTPSSTPSTVYTLRNANSGVQDYGNGKNYYLDRHNVDCGDDGINRFQLGRPTPTTTKYDYTCLEGMNTSVNKKSTVANDYGAASAIYLDRHDVNCNGAPITQFKLGRATPSQIHYDYMCGDASSDDCRDVDTGWNDESANTIYLDRHNVKCNDNEYVSRFKLNRNNAGKFRYDYKCCKYK